ncbi:MAG: peptidoglycan DD-metalloendopeptidase family protein [Actinomycetota bacterium]
MTRTHPSFPKAFRLLAVTLALAAVAVASSVAGATPTRQDLEQAQTKVKALLAEVADARDQLSVIDARLGTATAQVDAAEGKLEALTAQLLDTRARLEGARARYDEVTGRLNDRAAQAFMNGPASNVEFLLGSSSLGELSDRLEFVDAVAQSDADLAAEVDNLRVQLETDEASLQTLQASARKEAQKAEVRKQEILADFTLQQNLLASIDAKLAEAQTYEKKLSKAYKAALAAAASQGYGGGHSNVPMPAGWEHVLQVCPTGSPRSFGDGFGAPRYAGGYHLHKGVDILAPSGTPIYAPFAGYARTDYNSLGGNVVFVSGQYGTVYNAHLSAFSSSSNGAVSAGDIIGYVGDTGDATGIPHNHFEFHPNVMPPSWPSSYYGYSIIEDAINPYPLLVAACG